MNEHPGSRHDDILDIWAMTASDELINKYIPVGDPDRDIRGEWLDSNRAPAQSATRYTGLPLTVH